ncbi:phytanoyl- dioxygenase family protein [Rutstroemia sp. NJR-2017a BVV2]|nr:phytanoyl- dioxygenase family protein [Rutstroemia sp. NJR-2017a BVV2]
MCSREPTAREKNFNFRKPTTVNDRIQLGEGTTFLPGKKDPSIQTLIDHVLEHGYVILPKIYTQEQVNTANAEIARLEALEAGPASTAGRNLFEGFKTGRVYALADKSRAFDCFPTHPTVTALNDYFLQPNPLLSSFHTVVIYPGQTAQPIHTDDGLVALSRPRPLIGTGTMVSLDDFTADNGATTVIPKSHLWSDKRLPTREEMIPAIMPAGSMVYFLNTLWHSGGANTTDKPRRSIAIQYCQPWARPFENMTIAMGWEDLDKVPEPMLKLMGFSMHDFMGYVDGRSPRAVVEMRKKRLIEWALKEKEKQVSAKL